MKYYVTSGDIRVCLQAITPHEAAKQALLQYYTEERQAAPWTYVSEKGHERHADDHVYDTAALMVDAAFEDDDLTLPGDLYD